MIAIIDYGMGNLRSVQKAFEATGFPVTVTSEVQAVASAHGIVLPGVGAFGMAMENLWKLGMVDPIKDAVAAGKPFLGICLGQQLLFDESEELLGVQSGALPQGLSIFPGRVRKFPSGLKVPQMGWNQLEIVQPGPLFDGVEQGAYVYFVHSYHIDPADVSVAAAWTEYGLRFASAVQRGNVFAIQFHPEKSSAVGLQILRNFGKLVSN